MALMHGIRRAAVAVAAAVLVTVTPLPVVAAVTPTTVASPGQHAGVRGVTLLTGDQVFVQNSGEHDRVLTIRPGAGRDKVAFIRQERHGDTYVVPADALPLLSAGRLDERLFNVSKLVEFGYDDATRQDVPLIVTHRGPGATTLAPTGARVARSLPVLGGSAVQVPKAGAGRFWAEATGAAPQALTAGLSRIWLDGKVTASLGHSVSQVGAPEAWQAGHTGEGATVAVLDSGVDTTHPDLADAVAAERDFTGSQSGARDRVGHGTHVAGIITGNGAVSGGRYQGVAPDARLLNGKVLDDDGRGAESWVIAGMQWAVEHGADIVNMSLGSQFVSDGTDPMSQALNELTRRSGTLFVVASGNRGPQPTSVEVPAVADEALAVGAADRHDAVPSFSGRGPRYGDLAIKPDISAPGVDIVSALADGTSLPDVAPVVDGRYAKLSGTSMAAPHVAGAAAILAAQHPDWDADEIKPALMGAAEPRVGVSVYAQGAGRLDVARAVSQAVVATPVSISNGIVRWPHHDDAPITKTITYRNLGAEPITMEVAVDVRGPEGDPAPAGMFTVDQDRITVPAGGSAAVQLTTHTAVPAPDGEYEGRVVATGGQATVQTPVAVVREVESYDVTLSVINRNGEPATGFSDWAVEFTDLDQPGTVYANSRSGEGSVARVPRGRHFVYASIYTPLPDRLDLAYILEPTVTVTGPAHLVFDARTARPVGITVDRPDAELASGRLEWERKTANGSVRLGIEAPGLAGLSVRPSQTSAPPDEFTFLVEGHLARPDGSGRFVGSPYQYHVRWTHHGRVPTDLAHRARTRDLAEVRTHIAATAADQVAAKDWVDLQTPATLTEYYTPDVTWLGTGVLVRTGAVWSVMASAPTYRRGKPVQEHWNLGVIGPSFAAPASAGRPYGLRSGHTIDVILPLVIDQARARWGASSSPTRIALYRNGDLIRELPAYVGTFVAADEPSTYRLEAQVTNPTTVSTEIRAAWTFTSGHVPADQIRPLPLMAIRFAPDLDEHNQAKAGRPYRFPVYVQRQTGASYGTLRNLTVHVSYDDGATWQPARLAGSGLERKVLVRHPADAGFVSLKASATDSDGNAVEQTIIRAYALRK